MREQEDMIIVIGAVTTTPETKAEVLRMSREHCARSRSEPGCIAHNVHVDCEDPNRVVFVEYWLDAAALKAHFAVSASRAFAGALGKLSPTPPEMKVFGAEEVNLMG
jgi:quinol monooxygenase YgiN